MCTSFKIFNITCSMEQLSGLPYVREFIKTPNPSKKRLIDYLETNITTYPCKCHRDYFKIW